jgi:hypothetical protein
MGQIGALMQNDDRAPMFPRGMTPNGVQIGVAGLSISAIQRL